VRYGCYRGGNGSRRVASLTRCTKVQRHERIGASNPDCEQNEDTPALSASFGLRIEIIMDTRALSIKEPHSREAKLARFRVRVFFDLSVPRSLFVLRDTREMIDIIGCYRTYMFCYYQHPLCFLGGSQSANITRGNSSCLRQNVRR